MKWLRRAVIGALSLVMLYLGGSSLITRNYWVGVFWGSYLQWLPPYDIINVSRQSYQQKAQYNSVIEFIRPRLRTASTATFCKFSEAKFGTQRDTALTAMVGYVDAQNAFGAVIRSHFMATFEASSPTTVYGVHWLDDEKEFWRNSSQ